MLVAVGLYDRGMVGEGFTFELPNSEVIPYGAWVEVPMAGRLHRGVILGPGKHFEEVSKVERLLDHPLHFQLQEWQCAAILWMSEYYMSPLHRVLRLFIPLPLWRGTFRSKEEIMVHPVQGHPPVPVRQKKVGALVEHIDTHGVSSRVALREVYSLSVYNRAIQEGYVMEESLGLYPVRPWTQQVHAPRQLTLEQSAIIQKMEEAYPENALLYGVTGAGKTEIYLHRALQLREKGKQLALLIPEIALTPQLVSYFQRVFGNRVAVVHSRLAEGEKCQEWLRIARHEVDVVIGSRSGIFAPYAALGQIILDEEHEWTYKNEQNPRYLTHTVAEFFAQQVSCGVLFASGTPSIERYARARGDAPLDTPPLNLYSLEKRIYDQRTSS